MDPTQNDETADEAADGSTESAEATESPGSLLDAITDALAPTLPADDGADDETNTDDGDDEESDDESDGEDEAGDEEEGDEGAAEGDLPRGKDGKFVSADGKDKAAAGAGEAPKLGADGKPLVDDKAGKKADIVNDPIPEEVKGRTRERMTALIDTVKAKDAVIGDQGTVISAVRNTGAAPEEFAAMISYMGWAHSDDPAKLTQARDMLIAELEGISLKLGQPAPGIDFVAKYPDIQAKVEAGQLTQEDAQELAIARSRQKTQADASTAARTQSESTQQATRERNEGIAELDELGKTLMASDPQYVEKHNVLEPILPSLGMLPPKQWKKAFMAAYSAVKLPAASSSTNTPARGGKRPVQQPLRANKSPSGSTAGNRKPTSLADAVNAAIDQVDNT